MLIFSGQKELSSFNFCRVISQEASERFSIKEQKTNKVGFYRIRGHPYSKKRQ